MDPHEIARVAAGRVLEREERFAEYWRELSDIEQDAALMEVVRRVALFQGSFPPLKPLRRELSPISELRVRSELLGGDLVLSGQIDLVLGVPDRLEPTRATRLVVDLKTGSAFPEFAEDMRFYALVMTLRFGVPPYRAASLFLESGTWQAEDVTEELLHHAADRAIEAARAAAALSNGREPVLTPGAYCAWCPRAADCPMAELPSAV
jgi:hypothetical protein